MSGVSRLIRSATLYGYVDLARESGLDPSQQLRRVGLSALALQESDQLVRLDAALALLEHASQDSGLEDFGLRLAARRRLSNLGAVSVVLREEATALDALHSLCRFLQLVNPTLSTVVVESGEHVLIQESLLADQAAPLRQSIEMAVGVMHGVLRELLGDEWRARRICFSHRGPKDTRFAKQLFACPIEYNSDFNGLYCDRAPLVARLPGRDAKLARFAELSLRAAQREQRSAVDLVRQLIAVLLPQGRCNAQEVASQLGVDRRTLHRWLASEGETFSGLVQSFRLEFVSRQLTDSDRSITEIALLLGFSSSSSLAHWFKAQRGMSVRQWLRTPAMTQAPPRP
jgi:AraC-like DNA-binding protein